MILRNMLCYLGLIILITTQLWAQNTNPVVTNVAFSISGTTVTVTYDVADAEQNTVTISMEVSSDNGVTWNYDDNTPGPVTGDIGTGVVCTTFATTKTITWIYPGGLNSNFKIRIYANDETADGNPCPGILTVDYSGKTYNTVQIGTQCWLKENLDVGTMINNTTGGRDFDGNQTNNSTIEKFCFDEDQNNCTTYGGLYQWAEAVQYLNGATNTTSPNPVFSGNVQGICPTGWHIPTQAEFTTLFIALGNIGITGSETEWSNGNALKEIGQGAGDGAGTNTSGFSGLLAGYRAIEGGFGSLNAYLILRTSEESSPTNAHSRHLYYNDNFIVVGEGEKGFGFSVRCIKD